MENGTDETTKCMICGEATQPLQDSDLAVCRKCLDDKLVELTPDVLKQLRTA